MQHFSWIETVSPRAGPELIILTGEKNNTLNDAKNTNETGTCGRRIADDE